MDKGKGKAPNEWVTIAKKGSRSKVPTSINQWFVVFSGNQPGIYATWSECFSQINRYPGSCFKTYDTYEEARQAFFKVGIASKQFFHTDPIEISDFFNPGLSFEIYQNINGLWKSHISDQRKNFRSFLSTLANQIVAIQEKSLSFKELCLKIVEQIDWTQDFTLEKITWYLQFAELLDNDFPAPLFERIKRLCLLEKARSTFPVHVFDLITQKIENSELLIRSFYIENHEFINTDDDSMPKLGMAACYLWPDELIDWGIINKIIIQSHYPDIHFPAMIKAMIQKATQHWICNRALSIWISSSIGWYEKTRFFQPYQIWYLKISTDQEFEDHKLLNSLELAQSVNPKKIAINSIIHLKNAAGAILNSPLPLFLVTDGRRVFVTDLSINYPEHTASHISEAKALLTKMATFTLDDIPIHFLNDAEMEDHFRNEQDAQSPISDPAIDEYELHNIINMMEG